MAWNISTAIHQVAHGEPGERTEDAALFLYEEIQQFVDRKAALLTAATAVMLLDALKEVRREGREVSTGT